MEYVPAVDVTVGYPVVLHWTPYVPNNYSTTDWKLIFDGSVINSSNSYTSDTPISMDVMSEVPIVGNYNFTMVFTANQTNNLTIQVFGVGTTMVNILPLPTIPVLYDGDVTVFNRSFLQLNWTAYLPVNFPIPVGWNLSLNGEQIANGLFVNNSRVTYDASSIVHSQGDYNFTIVFVSENVGHVRIYGAYTTIIHIFVPPIISSTTTTTTEVSVTSFSTSTNMDTQTSSETESGTTTDFNFVFFAFSLCGMGILVRRRKRL